MTPDQEERLVCAFESIATQLAGIGKTLELDYIRRYPPQKKPTEPTITHIKTREEELREALGETGEDTVEDWLSLDEPGPRERAFLEEEASLKKRENARAAKRDTPQTGH